MINLFSKQPSLKVVAYIYSKNPTNKEHLFGCVRKVYNGGRIRHGIITGSCGTNVVYNGKWTNVGGSQISGFKHHLLWNVIKEIIDEACVNPSFINSRNVDLSPLGYPKTLKNNILKCCYFTIVKNKAIFIFNMKYKYFIHYFPKKGRTSAQYIRSSHGEIDAAQSYSTKNIVSLQNREVFNYHNNYFISYFLQTFLKIVVPYISSISKSYYKRWHNISNQIKIMKDIKPRKINELHHMPYIQ